jgi:hypothetical protein
VAERIDHASEARAMVASNKAAHGVDAVATAVEAQVHATLALAAEQRTANMIALLSTGKGTPQMRERLLAAVVTDLNPKVGA